MQGDIVCFANEGEGNMNRKIKNVFNILLVTGIVFVAATISAHAEDITPSEDIIPNNETVLLTAPKNVTAHLYGHDDVNLSWDVVEGVDGYYIYYKKTTDTEYTKAGETTESSFKLPDLYDHVKYSFRVVPYYLDETGAVYDNKIYGSTELTTKKNIKAPSRVSAYLYGHDDIKITWTKSSGANGYYVYYKKSSDSNYKYLGSTTKKYYKKANLTDGVKYTFKVVPRYSVNKKNYSSYYNKCASITTLKKVSSSVNRIGFSKMQLLWNNIDGETGYQISKASKKSKTNIVYTYKSSTASKKNFSPKLNKKYYYKIRAYRVSGGKRIYGPWSSVISYTLSKNYYPKTTLITKNNAFFDVRKESGQELYGYDIFQGSCTDGQNGYYVLYNKNNETCKIAKVRLSDNEVVKVSGVLNIHHGNDLTYNSKTKTILAVHMTGTSKAIAMIDPVTLRLERNQNIVIPSRLSGATSYRLKKITGFNAIAYDKSKDRYVLRIRNTGDYLITDGKLRPKKYVRPSVKKYSQRVYAGLDVMNGYIASAQASSNTGTFTRYNVIQLHDWNGKYKGCINVKKGHEMESVFNSNGKAYATFYHEYYENDKLLRNNYIYVFNF